MHIHVCIIYAKYIYTVYVRWIQVEEKGKVSYFSIITHL